MTRSRDSRASHTPFEPYRVRQLAEQAARSQLDEYFDPDQLQLFVDAFCEQTRQPAPEVPPDEQRFSPHHLELLKRVLLSKYLHRVMRIPYRHIGHLMQVDAGTACRLDHYQLEAYDASVKAPTPSELIDQENGISVKKSPNDNRSGPMPDYREH